MLTKHKTTITVSWLVLIGLTLQPVVVAQPYTSPSYKVEESFFGAGGELDPSSPNYKAQQAIGSLGAGFSSSSSFDLHGGFLTPNEPFLEIAVSNSTLDLGTLSDTSTSSGSVQAGACNCSFYIRTYLSSTYVVKTMSNPPTSEGGAQLNAKTTLGAPIIGTEEFGINLVDNTSPNVGANPVNQPDNSFADGEAATGYGTADQFKYVVGETIARSQKTATNPAIGRTDYTISYIANRASLTEAGLYTMNHDLVVIATY